MSDDNNSRLKPSDELLNKVRILAQYNTEIDVEKSRRLLESVKSPGERIEGIRDESLFALEKVLIGIRLSSKKSSKGLFNKKHEVAYQVSSGQTPCLEFTDAVHGRGLITTHTLKAVSKYNSGNWEQQLDDAYRKCQEIQNLRDQIPILERKLKETENSTEVVGLIEKTSNPGHTINLLLLSKNYSSNLDILSISYMAIGKASDAIKVIQIAERLHPENGALKLALGNIYLMALWNDKGWAPDVDPGPMKQITLDLLNCNYEIAAGSAEMLFNDAIRLSNDSKVISQAREQLKTLKMMDDLYGTKGDR